MQPIKIVYYNYLYINFFKYYLIYSNQNLNEKNISKG